MTIHDISCAGGQGEAIGEIIGGTPPYSNITFTNGINQWYGPTAYLPAGTYYVSVSDKNSCPSKPLSIVISQASM